MTADALVMEASLERLADTGVELRHGLYRRFFAANPDRVAAFLCPDATSRRMTDETLQMLYGLASGEDWVETLIAELVATHRSYGDLKLSEYDSFIDLLVVELGETLGPDWTPQWAAAWRRQADQLKAMIVKAQADWDRILPTKHNA
jgi:hemoglobin-like flavoprotein